MKRILQKSLFRLQTLLLLAVMFVVGGSASWAETVTFSNTEIASTTTKSSIKVTNSGGNVVQFAPQYTLFSYGNSITVSSETANITKVEISGMSLKFDCSQTGWDNNSAIWEGTTHSIVFSGAAGNSSYVSGITVTYSGAPATPVDYTVVIDNPEDAVGAGVKYKDNLVEGNTISTTDEVTANDFSIVPVTGYSASGSLNGTTYTATYTKKYAYTVSLTGLTTGDLNKGAIIYGNNNENALANGGPYYFDNAISDFEAKSVKYYDKSSVTVTENGKDITLSATYTPYTDVNLTVTGLTDEQRRAFNFQISGESYAINATIKVTTSRTIDDLVSSATAQNFKGLKYVKSYDSQNNTITVAYSEMESAANYDFASTSPSANSFNDESVQHVKFYLPVGYEFDVENYSGQKQLTVQRGDETEKNINVQYTIDGGNHCVDFDLANNRAYCGPISITIPAGSIDAATGTGADRMKTTNNAMTLTYNTKYHYSVTFAGGSEWNNSDESTYVTVTGSDDHHSFYSSFSSETLLNPGDVTVHSPSVYEGEVTEITTPNNTNGGTGTIYVKYSKIYTYDSPSVTSEKSGVEGLLALSEDELTFPKKIYTIDSNKSITIDGEPIAGSARIEDNKLYISLNPAIVGAGQHMLVIPKGRLAFYDDTFVYANRDSYHRNNEITITYTLVDSKVYDITISGINQTQLPAGAGIKYRNGLNVYHNGETLIVGEEVVEGDVQVQATAGYSTDVTITAPTAEHNGNIAVTYELNVTDLAYTNDVTEGVYALTSDVLHFEGAVTVNKQPTFSGNGTVTVEANGNDLNITFPVNLGIGTYRLTFPHGALSVGGAYNAAFTVPYQVVPKQMLYASAYVNGETTTTNSVTVEKFSNVEIFFDEAFAEGVWSMPNGMTFKKGDVDVSTWGGYTSAQDAEYKYHSFMIYFSEISDFGTYTVYIPEGVFTSIEGHTNAEVNFEIVIPEPEYFAAMTVTPATGATEESLKTFTLTAPAGVTFNSEKDLQGRVTVNEDTYSPNNIVFAEDKKSVTFDLSEQTTDGDYTVTFPAGFVRSTDGKWSPELTATYTVSYPWFTLSSYNVTPAAGEVPFIENITIAAPDGVDFATPAANVVIKVNGENTSVDASLNGEGKIVLGYTATEANRYEITIPASTFSSTTGKANKELTGITYTIQPTLAINANAVDSEGNYWTSFCLNKSFTLEDGYTPYIVVEKAEGGIELEEVVGTPIVETYNCYFNSAYGDATEHTDHNGTINSSNIAGKYQVTYTVNGTQYDENGYYDINSPFRSLVFTITILDGAPAPSNAGAHYYNPTASTKVDCVFAKTGENTYTVTVDNTGSTSHVGGFFIEVATGEYNKPIIPANEGILVKGAAKSNIQYTQTSGTRADVSGNLLWGCTQSQTKEVGDDHIYKLAWNKANYENELYTDFGFYWGSADGHSMQALAGKAYLVLPADAASSNRLLIFGGSEEQPTAIDSVVELSDDAPIFTLQGKRVSRENLPAGVYVKNGRKFIVK